MQSNSPHTEPLPVSPEILRRVGDPGRPTQGTPFSRDLAHVPGRSGLVAGVQTLASLVRRGEDYMSGLAQKHGPVFRHMLGTDPIVFVADPDLIWSIIRNEEGVWSAALAWSHLLGGLDSTGPGRYDFAPHRDVRRLFQPAFGAPAIAGYLSAAEELYAREMDLWVRRGHVRFKAEVRRLFATVSARVFMGIEDAARAERLDRAMIEGWQGVLALRKRSNLSIAWQRSRRGIAAIWTLIRSQPGSGTDLLSRLRATRDEADWLDDEATRLQNFIGIMFAAFDTTSSGVTAMAYLLAKHPEWQDKLREEACALATERPTPDDLKKLERTDWVWKEALRLYPVAGQLPRQSLWETQLGGHRIPAGAGVWAMFGTAMRDPKWWSEPLRFDPERFSPARAEDRRHKAIFLPFGGGPHACIGAQLATIEAKAFWHALLPRCRFRLRRDYTARHGYRPIGIVSGDVELVLEPLRAR